MGDGIGDGAGLIGVGAGVCANPAITDEEKTNIIVVIKMFFKKMLFMTLKI